MRIAENQFCFMLGSYTTKSHLSFTRVDDGKIPKQKERGLLLLT